MAGKLGLWRRFLRPFLAWLAACLFAALVMMVTYVIVEGTQTSFSDLITFVQTALFFAVFAAIVTLIPAPVLVVIARRQAWPRGWADALVPALLVFLIWGVFFASQYTVFADWWRGFLTGASLVPAALSGGITYWLLAGRPAAPTRPVSSTKTDL